MQGKFHLVDTDRQLASMTISMTMADWKKLKSQLDEKYPSRSLDNLIFDLVSRAENALYKDVPDTETEE